MKKSEDGAKGFVVREKTTTYKALFCETCNNELIRMGYGSDKVMLICIVCDKVYWSKPEEISSLLA